MIISMNLLIVLSVSLISSLIWLCRSSGILQVDVYKRQLIGIAHEVSTADFEGAPFDLIIVGGLYHL